MPRLLICLLAAAGSLGVARASDITVVIDFEGEHSARSVEQMKREAEAIFKNTGLHLDWRSRGEASRASYENLVVVRFKGKCILDPVPMLFDERGPFAFAYSSDGDVLPFSEVECDRITASVQPVMGTDDFARPDYLMGRAMGRVVAHELIHILTASASHGHDGVTKSEFSGRELIGAPLRLSREESDRLRQALEKKPASERDAKR